MLQRKDGGLAAGYRGVAMGTIPTEPTERLTVAETLRRWPSAADAFQRRGMACPGCAMAPFDTIVDAASSYGIRPGELLAEVVSAAARPQGGAR